MALKNAVEMMGYDFEGKQHRAVDDAINGARLLMLMKDRESHRRQKQRIEEVYNCNKPFTSTIGELLSGKLAALRLVS
jgi:inhibitor of KinA sporulation pathway (predicted exonuclease)